MQTKKRKSPSLRFRGYTDDWEDRKLKDVLDISKTKNKAQQYGKVDVLSVSREVGTVNQIKYQGRSFAGSDLSNYKVVQGGELIYTKSPLKGAPYGIFQVATIKGILSPLYAVYTSTDKAYTPFVAMALKNDNIATHYLTPLVTKGAKNTINVTDEGALEGKIQFPSILEQKQIFIFFKQLDDTIALHQRKLDLLKEQKKGFLQKMFPKNGARVPELRFAGFADDWEERKLGSLTTVVRGASPRPIQDPKWFDKESDIGWLRIADVTEQNGRIYHLEQHISKLGQEKTRVLTEPHLLLSIAATVGKPVVNYVKTGVHDGFLIFLNPTFEREFMFQWLEMFRPKWQKYGQPGSQVNLNSELVRNQEIVLPNYKEQQKIGSFFKQLDNTITLHQRKLDLLKEQKKGFLQKMFV
ncbi:restriction endonuclease subunit S [Leuconostoc suionicum]|uniref:restriction endonuclease subunit S n=1 Tax=Leuconostoc TaxID=1243 RepID=UPI0021A80CF6|nr:MULTISPECIES: restriction endonuclease subunit S [Leuconostoc]MCT3045800.1 restriction endonuclease subunit S [Leuconostoc mesenteroides]MDI6545405.1 restriction endonuclease subunit S [Leuconostoc suionicum]